LTFTDVTSPGVFPPSKLVSGGSGSGGGAGGITPSIVHSGSGTNASGGIASILASGKALTNAGADSSNNDGPTLPGGHSINGSDGGAGQQGSMTDYSKVVEALASSGSLLTSQNGSTSDGNDPFGNGLDELADALIRN
jgi:hypothetical protein